MTISDAKIVRALPAGAKNIKKSDGSVPTIQYVPVHASLIANKGAETDVSGWQKYDGAGSIVRSTAQAKNGAASFLCTRGNQDLVAVNIDASKSLSALNGIVAYAGETMHFSAWVRKPTGATSAYIDLYVYDSAGGAIASKSTNDVLENDVWRLVSSTLTLPANAAYVLVYMIVVGSAGQTAYFDDVTIRRCVPLVESPFTEPTTTGSSTSGALKADPIAADVYYAGDVKVFDMGAETSLLLAESSYTRVYGARHKYVGGVLLDNGILRVRLLKGYDIGAEGGSIAMSVYVDGAWQAAFDVSADTGGDSDAPINAIAVTRNARASAVVKCTDTQGNSFVLTLERGAFLVRVDTTRVAETLTRQDFQVDHPNMPARVKDAGTIVRDAGVTSTVSTTGSALTEPYYLAFGSTVGYLLLLVFPRKPSTIEDTSSIAIWRQTSPGTANYQRSFWVGAIPWPQLTTTNAYLCECEAGTDRAGTPTTVADAAASSGNAVELNAQNEEKIGPALVVGRDIPLGEYTLVLRAKDSNQVTDDLAVAVWNATDAAHQFVAAKTVTAAYAYYSTDVALTSAESGDTIHVSARKRLSNANTITVDRWYLIPKKRNSVTPSHVFFPRDVARNALMQVTMRESVRKK